MKMKCLDFKLCVYHNESCWYDAKSNGIGTECIQTPEIYLANHPDRVSVPVPEIWNWEEAMEKITDRRRRRQG